MLKTLGSMRILCPVPEFPCLESDASMTAAFWLDLVTKPGTEDLRISSNSFCSACISEVWSVSDNLNIFYGQ